MNIRFMKISLGGTLHIINCWFLIILSLYLLILFYPLSINFYIFVLVLKNWHFSHLIMFVKQFLHIRNHIAFFILHFLQIPNSNIPVSNYGFNHCDTFFSYHFNSREDNFVITSPYKAFMNVNWSWEPWRKI